MVPRDQGHVDAASSHTSQQHVFTAIRPTTCGHMYIAESSPMTVLSDATPQTCDKAVALQGVVRSGLDLSELHTVVVTQLRCAVLSCVMAILWRSLHVIDHVWTNADAMS